MIVAGRSDLARHDDRILLPRCERFPRKIAISLERRGELQLSMRSMRPLPNAIRVGFALAAGEAAIDTLLIPIPKRKVGSSQWHLVGTNNTYIQSISFSELKVRGCHGV